MVMIVIMMKTAKSKKMRLDWETLDKHWSDAYEADYGHFFSDAPVERMNFSFSICTIARGRTPVKSLF